MTVLCVGQLVGDVVIRPVSSPPVLGRTELVSNLELVAGGCAANTASCLAKLGVDTAVAGVIGRDCFGDVVVSELVACSVDVTPIIRDSSTSTSAVVVFVQEDGERSFLYREGGNEVFKADSIADEHIVKASMIHIGGAMKLRSLNLSSLLARAKAAGCITSLDTDWDTNGMWAAALAPALPQLDYLLTNEEEGSMIAGIEDPVDIGRRLLSMGPRIVILKRGKYGAMLFSHDREMTFPAFDLPVVDTTCAGDGFAAGFLFALVQGWELDAAVTFGNAVGALCMTTVSHAAVDSVASVLDVVGNALDTFSVDELPGEGVPAM